MRAEHDEQHVGVLPALQAMNSTRYFASAPGKRCPYLFRHDWRGTYRLSALHNHWIWSDDGVAASTRVRRELCLIEVSRLEALAVARAIGSVAAVSDADTEVVINPVGHEAADALYAGRIGALAGFAYTTHGFRAVVFIGSKVPIFWLRSALQVVQEKPIFDAEGAGAGTWVPVLHGPDKAIGRPARPSSAC